jgi:hypothetical protein
MSEKLKKRKKKGMKNVALKKRRRDYMTIRTLL